VWSIVPTADAAAAPAAIIATMPAMPRRCVLIVMLLVRLIGALTLGACAGSHQTPDHPLADRLERFEFTRIRMGVPARIVLHAPDRDAAERAADAAFTRMADLEQILSDYRPDSEASRLAASPTGRPVPVSPDLFAVLRACEHLSHVTDGAFDVTVGPATRAWRQARDTGRLPDGAALAAIRARIGWQAIRLDPAASTATLLRSDLALDFGGIGKGWAAQAAVDLLRSRGGGCERCLVALAGDIALGDPPPGRHGWRIDLPTIDTHPRIISLANAAVSTSGDSTQYVELLDARGEPRRFAHIVDPRTALGIPARRSVTMIASRGEWADALATAAFILGPEAAAPLLDRSDWGPPAAAIFLEGADDSARLITLDPSRRLP
jgi:thiamine biosynthesis lipoprotein